MNQNLSSSSSSVLSNFRSLVQVPLHFSSHKLLRCKYCTSPGVIRFSSIYWNDTCLLLTTPGRMNFAWKTSARRTNVGLSQR